MLQTFHTKKNTISFGRFFSLKLITIFVGLMLIVGNVTAKHSADGIQMPDFWTAAKDFWQYLRSPEPDEQNSEQDKLNQDEQLVNLISDELSATDEADDLGLEELMNNPICKSVYVADYSPTFNKEAIDKCSQLIEQQENKVLFEHYVAELCQNTAESTLSKKEITEVQLRLRKYSLTFPQANFQVNLEDVDGIYGTKTCEYVAHYQIDSQYYLVDGQPDELLYEQLSNTIPLSESELQEFSAVTPKPRAKILYTKAQQVAKQIHPQDTVKVPRNPLKRIVFCMKHPKASACQTDLSDEEMAKLEIEKR